MEEFVIRLAGHNIRVKSRFASNRGFFADYIVPDEDAEFAVSVSDEEMKNTKNATEGLSPGRIEFTGMYRPIAEKMPFYDGLVIHGAAISYEGKGYIFTAPSGTGKTTHIKAWRKFLGKSVGIVNGDKPILTVKDGTVYVHGTPWSGKERWQKNCSVPLGGICLLNRGTVNEIRPATTDESIPFLFRQTYIPQNTDAVIKTMELMDVLLKNVPVYMLYCDTSENAVKCSFERLCSKNYDDCKVRTSDMKIKSGFVLRDIAGQAVVIATGEASKDFHGMVKLNETAKDIWQWLSDGRTVPEIAEKLAEKYSVDKSNAAADVMEMVEKMEKAGFLES